MLVDEKHDRLKTEVLLSLMTEMEVFVAKQLYSVSGIEIAFDLFVMRRRLPDIRLGFRVIFRLICSRDL